MLHLELIYIRCQPDTCARLDAGLVAVKVVLRREVVDFSVLVQVIALIFGAACHAGAVFNSGGAVTDVVVIVGVGVAAEGGGGEFAAAVVREGIIPRGVLAGGVARGRAGGGIAPPQTLSVAGMANMPGCSRC